MPDAVVEHHHIRRGNHLGVAARRRRISAQETIVENIRDFRRYRHTVVVDSLRQRRTEKHQEGSK